MPALGRGLLTNQLGNLPDPVADAIHEMVKLNPDLAKQPEALNQLATRFHTTPKNIQQNLALQAQHQMSMAQTARSMVGSVGGALGKVFGGIAHGLTNAVGLHQDPTTGAWSHTVDQGMLQRPVNDIKSVGQGITNPTQMFGQIERFGKAAAEATPQFFRGIGSQFLDYAKMAGEVQTDPLQFLKDVGGQLSDTALGTRTLISGTASDIKRNGWATGLGHLFPATVAMLIAHRPLMAAIGPEVSAAEARAAATAAQTARDKAFLADTPMTGGLSFEAQAELANAAARVRSADPLWTAKSELDELSQLAGTSGYASAIPRMNELNARIRAAEEAAKAAEEAASKRAWSRTGFSKWDKLAQKIGSAPASGFAMTVNAARAFNRLAGGTRMNLLALLQNPVIKQADPKVWEEAKQGKVVDAYGNVTTVGDEIANLMNQPDGFFHKLIANFANFDLTFVADDPLVKSLKIAQQGRSFAGYTGTLGKYFGGIGITGVGDVGRAYRQYSAVRRAIDYIAGHSSSEILSTFGPTIFTGKLLRRLGETSTPDEVISVLDDVVAGGEMVGSTVPMLGWYSTFKTALRGTLGDRFGFLGRLLESDAEITPNIAKQVKEETGYDISVKNRNFQRMNVAGKSNVVLRQRLRTLFVKQPEWYNEVTNKMTNRDIVPGSINAIEGIMNMLRAVHLPEETVLSMGDALIHSAGDVRAYNRAYRAAMYETVMRPLQATMSAAEYEAINRAIGDHVWEHIDKMIGADGGGVTGAYVASKDEWRNTIAGPMGDMRAGIGETHLGMLKLPNARQMKMLQRNLSNIVLEMRSNGALKVLTDTTASLKDIKEMANFSRETVESVIANLRTVLREARAKTPELWENENLYNGFANKVQSMVRTYSKWLSEEAFKGLERGEKIALVVKDLGDELVSINEKYSRLSMDISSRLGIVPPAFTEAADRLADYAERTGTTPDALMRAVDQLRGEQQAVEEMLAKINATLNESFTSGVSVENIAKTIAAMTLENGEARAAFVKAFKARWTSAAEKTPRIAGKIEKLLGGSGQRDLRSNRDIITDIIQSYLNGYFKPLTLTSPGWAMRVSMSELMLNTFRIGGMNMFSSNLASSIAKHEFKLAKSALELTKLGKQEKLVLRNVIGNVMVGFEREVLDRISEGQATRLVNDAMDLMLDHDGHLPMGMSHGSGDKMTADTIDNAGLSQVWGIDANGKLTSGYYFRGENWVTINGSDAGAGTALHENINRVFNDGILSVGAKYLHEEAQRIGAAAFAANEGMYTQRIIDEAVKRIEGGAGADAWKARNAFLDDLRSEITSMSEFKALNEAERNAVLSAISNSAKKAEDLVTDDFPKYLRKTYEAANRRIVNLENAIPRIESEISKQEKLVADLEAEWLAKQDERTDRLTMGEQLDEADRELRTLGSARTLIDAEIANHPFRRYYTILERGAALDPYKPILGDLRRELYENLSQAQESTQERISALLGGRKVVLPRGGFADMSEERLLTFRDADGNPVPNEELYREAFEKHPELWSDNESYARHVPFGMPGVDGADFLNSVGGLEKVADVQRLMRYEQQLSTAAEMMANGNYKGAYEILSNIDPVNVSEMAPLLEAGTPSFSKAGDPFSVNGVPLDLILGHGRTKEKTLADLALHVQQQRNIRPTIFRKTFHPNYSMDAEGEARFKADFERFQKLLTAKDTENLSKKVEIPKAEYYHGSSRQIDQMQDILSSSSNNLFGPGFYTTENPEIARSYTGKGAGAAERDKALNKTVHGIKWEGKGKPKLLDLDATAPDFLRNRVKTLFEGSNSDGELSKKMAEAINDPKITAGDLHRVFQKELANDSEVPVDEVRERIAALNEFISEEGYDGMTHIGGGRMGSGEVSHKVTIFFEPESKLSISSSTAVGDVAKAMPSLSTEKENAAKWFTAAIGPEPGLWATTANKVWKQNLDTARAMAARDADRSSYYDLLERRKELSAQRSKIGVRKREILKKAGALPEVSPEETAAERTFLAESDKLDALYANRESTDIALAKAHIKRDDLEQHVLTQDEKFRDRASKRAMAIYRKRIATGTKGMSKLMRRIESRTATINAQVERQTRQIVDETISGLSSASLSGEQMQELRGRLRDVMFSHLTSMPQDELQRFARAYFPRAQFSTGDPMMDWADDIAEHLITLSTGAERGTFFPEIAEQMATGNAWGPQKMARWLSERANAGKDIPSNFPARQFISPFAKGSRNNLLIAASDRIHSKVLGPIVNELVREPLFVWEYHMQMEKLRPLVEAKWLTYDQAKVKASVEASINMNKFVHDPLGKQVWENNMRTLAPYYFAKNQAIRRFARMAGDDPAQALKYLRLNLAITDYIGQASDGSGQFHVPGGEVLGSIGAGVTGPLATLLGYKQSGMFGALNFGFDASPNSLMSVILTGTKPGAYNVFREMIAVPFGPVVAMPAKFLYQYVSHHNPMVRAVMHQLLGEAALNTTLTDDLLPNPFLRNTVKMAYGMTAGQNNPSSYASTENQVLKDKAQQLYSNFYDEAAKEHPSLSSIELAQFGSKEQLWGFYAGQKFAAYMNNADNYHNFLNEANLSAAVLYSLKNIISYSSPTALSIGERFSKNKELQAIMDERDAQGQKKFPTYILAVDEYMKRYPKQVFDLVSVTKSSGARWSTTAASLKVIDENFSHLGKYRNALSFLVSQKDTGFDSEALRVEYEFNLREKQTPREFLKSLNVAMGWRWYDQMYKAYKANPAFLDDNGELSYPAAMQLRQQALIYGQTVNHDWLADKNSGKRNTVAYETYNEMKKMVSDKAMTKAFAGSQRGYFQELVKFREGFVEAYKTAQANGESLGRYRSQWYDACTSLSEDPAWQEYSSFITNVLRNLPAPQ